MLPALTSLFTNKKFEKQADIFACEVAEKSNGLINFYERLGQRDQLHAEEFDKISDLLRENGGDMPILHYIGLLISYYMAKAEHGVAKAYNKLAYPSVQERIEAAKKYMQQEA